MSNLFNSRIFHFLTPFVFLFLISACAPQRRAIPAGEVPSQDYVSPEDEAYGHEVFGELSQRYQLETKDEYINRARDIVDKLANAASANKNPWHLEVFKDPSVVNAAATRGNYVFIWSGLFSTIKSDADLATVLAHEMGHVLAGHTMPTPEEEVNEILAEVSGNIAQEALAYTPYGGLAELAGMLVSELVKAAVVNPGSQDLELEADQVGLFLMADAGYDPKEAVAYWQRAVSDPRFSNGPAEFLSTHPATETRLQRLESLLPQAEERYQAALHPGKKGKTPAKKGKTDQNPQDPTVGLLPEKDPVPPVDDSDSFALNPDDIKPDPAGAREGHTWIVQRNESAIYKKADGLEQIEILEEDQTVKVVGQDGLYLEISEPVHGYIRGRDLRPR